MDEKKPEYKVTQVDLGYEGREDSNDLYYLLQGDIRNVIETGKIPCFKIKEESELFEKNSSSNDRSTLDKKVRKRVRSKTFQIETLFHHITMPLSNIEKKLLNLETGEQQNYIRIYNGKPKYIGFDTNRSFALYLIIDYNKFSQRYKISKYNDTFMEYRENGFEARCIRAYSDNTYEVNGYETDRDFYDMVRKEFTSVSKEEIKEKNIVISKKGRSPKHKRDVNIVESVSCNSKFSIHIPSDKLTEKWINDISADCKVRSLIWLNDEKYMDVSDCIVGLHWSRRLDPLDVYERDFLIELLRPLCERYNKNIRHEEYDNFPYVYDYFVLCD